MVEVSIENFKILYVNIKRKIGAVSLILTMQFLRNAFVFHSTLSFLFPLSLSLVLKNKVLFNTVSLSQEHFMPLTAVL